MLNAYLEKLYPPALAQSVQETTTAFMQKLNATGQKKVKNVLLLGNVQSGKTAQVLGVLSALADDDYKVFLYLTTDSIDLQNQTLTRAKNTLDKFIVLNETDEAAFEQYFKQNLPILVVIKKNARILQRWRNTFASKSYLKSYPLVIVDDEADAASLNTNNSKKQQTERSRINDLLNDIKNACCQSLFVQLTATPQAILLQNLQSEWQPEFVHYFTPGNGYIGGDFVFSDPVSYIARFIDPDEDIQDKSRELSDDARRALHCWLLTCAEFALCGKENCNFAIHPSHKIKDHQAFADKIQAYLNDLVQAVNYNEDEDLNAAFQESYLDLQKTKPDIHHFEDIYAQLCELLEQQRFDILTLNSKSNADFDLAKGFNIIVGGNVIGRGLTIPKLQTVYYSRMSKKPNADTFWQHARIFGYDRNTSLLRLYIPRDVYHFFVTLNQANRLLIAQACNENGKIEIIYPEKINPTRKNVLELEYINLITGGVNYFPDRPNETNCEIIDKFINDIENFAEPTNTPDLYQIEHDTLIELLNLLGKYDPEDWNKEKFISSINALRYQRPSFKSYILIKQDRDIGRATGTMLSPDDRKLGDKYSNDLFLTIYRVRGGKNKDWQGKPFWLPNIKLPHKGLVYWSI